MICTFITYSVRMPFDITNLRDAVYCPYVKKDAGLLRLVVFIGETLFFS